KPVPTTIISYLRLLAGFTSFKSNLCLLHFSAKGPAGIFEFNIFYVFYFEDLGIAAKAIIKTCYTII
ncbi:MAG: hypothetical protein EAY66_00985, partial [Sphingobacteriales bacterium]